MHQLSAVALAVAISLLFPGTAPAQDGPQGIAFVVAPEQSSGVCFAGNADKAFACARKQCTEGGAAAADCLRVAWCYPSGWAADVFLQNNDGFHWHEYLCGWDSRETLEAAAAVKCDKSLRGELLECAVTQMWDSDGNEMKTD